jgi:hypothetical protein
MKKSRNMYIEAEQQPENMSMPEKINTDQLSKPLLISDKTPEKNQFIKFIVNFLNLVNNFNFLISDRSSLFF